jgi:ribosomal protein S6--L-glutamate ligase
MNISSGGKSYPYDLNKEQVDFCFTVMERGKFPYAHLDLQITESGKYYLSEIALNGGLKGARITREELDQQKQELLEKLAASNVS